MQFDREAVEELILMLGCVSLCLGLISSDFIPWLIEIKDSILYGK